MVSRIPEKEHAFRRASVLQERGL